MHEYEQQQEERNKTAGGLIELTLLDRIIAVFTRISKSLDDCLNKREPPDDDSDDDADEDGSMGSDNGEDDEDTDLDEEKPDED